MKLFSKLNRMNRKKQTAIFLIIIAAAIGWKTSPYNREYSSPEAVLYACEKGLRYGPSEKIEYVRKNGNKAVAIGRVEGGLSIIPSERKWYGRWILAGGSIPGYVQVENNAEYDFGDNIIVGVCTYDEIKSVEVVLGVYDEKSVNGVKEVEKYKADVAQDGFFIIENIPERDTTDDSVFDIHVVGFEGFDENGNSVYSTSVYKTEVYWES